MPLDSRIPAMVGAQQQGGGGDMFGTLRGLQAFQQEADQAQGRRLLNEQRRRALEDDYALRETLQRTGDPDQAIEELWRGGRPTAAFSLAKGIYAQRDQRAKAMKSQADADDAFMKQASQMLQTVEDQPTYALARRGILQYAGANAEKYSQYLPEQYDAATVKQLVGWGRSASDQMTAEKNALQRYFDISKNFREELESDAQLGKSRADLDKVLLETRDKQRAHVGELLSTARSQQQWDLYQGLLRGSGTPADVLAEFGGAFSPEAVDRAKTLTVGQKDKANIIHQKNADAMSLERLANDNRRVDQAQQRIDKPGAGGASGSAHNTLSASGIRQAAHDERTDWEQLEEQLDARYPRKKGVRSLTPEDEHDIAAEKLRLEDSHRSGRNMPPLIDTERTLLRDPMKKGDLEMVRKKIRALTGMKQTPIEQSLDLARRIQAEQNPQKKAALQQQQNALIARYGLSK